MERKYWQEAEGISVLTSKSSSWPSRSTGEMLERRCQEGSKGQLEIMGELRHLSQNLGDWQGCGKEGEERNICKSKKKGKTFGFTSGAQDGDNVGDEDELNPGEHRDARIRNGSCT